MKRLAIFSFYDEYGIVDSYISILLQEIKLISSNIIAVINGRVNQAGKQIFAQYVDRIIIRDNIGNDGGAYADVCINYLGNEIMQEYDEIVFCNDTFFGPFESFKYIFRKMEKFDVDFWGLNTIQNGFWSFIESYFLVFRRSIIKDKSLYNFCKKIYIGVLKDPNYSYYVFELGIYHYLVNRRYKPGYYTNTQNVSIYFNPDICIRQYKLPILKKKSFSPIMYKEERQIYVLKYIKEYYRYDIKRIIECIKRKYEIGIDENEIINYELTSYRSKISDLYVPVTNLTDVEIQKFLDTGDKVYIYGAGIYGKIIWYLYQEYISDFGGFIVSDEKYEESDKFCDINIIRYSEIETNAKIIIGLNKKNTDQVMNRIDKSEKVLVLWK